MPKKQPKNAYFFYMLHFKEQEAKRGKFYPGGISEISTVASESWKNMNAQQRGPFEKQAKDAKVGPAKEVEKYTSQGIPLSQIIREEKAANLAQQTMKTTIKEIVQNAYTNNIMGSQEYYFVAGNYFIMTTDEMYLPAELAIIKFTFDDGIVSKFHTYVNPEKLPLGFQYEAKTRSEETHRLPIPPNAKGEKNYQSILEQINRFMGNARQLPPLFTTKDNIAIIKSFIREFCALSDDNEDRYRVYPLHQLFFDIKEEAAKYSINGMPFQSIHIAEAHLNRDQYVYLKDTACNYHEELDCSKFCALSYVQRWAFIFADHICADLNIALIPGQHLPPEVDVSHVNSTLNESKLNDTVSSYADRTESHRSSTLAPSSNIQPSWARRPATPDRQKSSSNDDDFPSLGTHGRNKAGPSKKRGDRNRDYNNPWNTSTSSSDSNPWSGRHDTSELNDISVSRSRGRGSELNDSFSSSTSRGMGRGSELFQNSMESQRGRGRLYNDDQPVERDHDNTSRRDKRYHPWRSETTGDRETKRRH